MLGNDRVGTNNFTRMHPSLHVLFCKPILFPISQIFPFTSTSTTFHCSPHLKLLQRPHLFFSLAKTFIMQHTQPPQPPLPSHPPATTSLRHMQRHQKRLLRYANTFWFRVCVCVCFVQQCDSHRGAHAFILVFLCDQSQQHSTHTAFYHTA